MTDNFKRWRDAGLFDWQSIVAAATIRFQNLGGEA
jgi:hypothetical protein